MKKSFNTIIFCVITSLGFSQSQELLGQLLDSKTQQPVVFATVAVKDQNVGVIADDNGNFRLPIKYKTNDNIIVISCIGYKTLAINVNTLIVGQLNILKMVPQIESLDAVTIVANKSRPKEDYIPAKDIVKNAIFNMRVNYPTNPHSYIGYYRDYQILNKKYFNLNEGIMEEFDAGFQTNKVFYKDNQTAIYSFEQNEKFPQDSMLTVAYDNYNFKFMEAATLSDFGGNELSILNIHNAIRNYEKKSFSFVDVFKEDFLYNHEFRVTSKMYLDDKPIYEIKFYAIEQVTGVENTADGTIYIAYDTFAIHKLEYNGYLKNDQRPFYSVTVEYKPKGGKMYLNYISFYNRFKVKSGDSFKIETIEFDPSQKAFLVKFSNKIDKSTIAKKRRFKFKYNDERLKINDVKLISPRRLKVSIVNRFGDEDLANFKTLTGIEYKIRNVADLAGRQLDELSFLNVDQFREFCTTSVYK
ncbi:CarboxypepD_reg-like domain-containing protein [Formosa sp. Hel1_31_208]|uniref:carboxypeptidase-like regulatory domain-containing protein n=1 Tax=Formosa sp. Hel1_31_208 TaxID=1798225 RepID=UPI00087A4E77|nr:carboxypeptidase-like regulatory domain-containing protein [Formosa sp. Hel1_31_208]SDS60215.1 CarboxypepD_reg-like domain-containing protein [Formosa sp. Hel1_31_208]